MKFPGVVAVLCVVPSGLVLHIGITSCTFPSWTEMSKKNRYDMFFKFEYSCVFTVAFDCDFFAISEKNSPSLL